MIKLITFDLDNTLALIGKGISVTTENLIKNLEARSIRIAICSGKPLWYLLGLARQLELSSPILIGENGADIQVGVSLPPEQHFHVEIEPATKVALNEVRERITKQLPEMYFQANQFGVTPFPRSEEEFTIIEGILSEYDFAKLGLAVYRHVDSFDIVPADVNKGTGLKMITDRLGIIPSEMIAVGDGENDYPMFEYAGLSIGVNVKDESKVDVNFSSIDEALKYVSVMN